MADKKKEQELEERKKKRESKKLDDADLGPEVSGGSITNVNYTATGEITNKIKSKI